MKVETGIVKKHYQLFIGKIKAKIQELYPEADGNYMGFKRKGAEENTYVLKVQLYLKLSHLYEIYTRVDSLSRSYNRIDGFPQ